MQSLADLARLPFTTKEDLRLNYPYGMFAVPMRDVVRIHSSSGTTGKPTVVGYTRQDLQTWTELVARFMTAAGVTEDDIVHIAFGYGLFTGAFGLHYGAERIGSSVIPMSSGNTDKQIMIMQDYRSSVLVSTPSYALTIADRLEKLGSRRCRCPCASVCSAPSRGASRCAANSRSASGSSPPTITDSPK